MKIFGIRVPFTKAVPNSLAPVRSRGGWWPIVRESFAGAWQRNVTVDYNTVLTNPTIFSCITLIAADISKLRIKLVEQIEGIWQEIDVAAYSPVLRKPNAFQNRIQFIASWIVSKLTQGNTYVLKGRDNRGVVKALYVLDPLLVTPLVTQTGPDGIGGDVYYRLQRDDLSGIPEEGLVVPASEIIHDRMNCLFHPLVGLSPIFAAGLSATQGLKIIEQSAKFFSNASRPGGLLIAPDNIDQADADRLKKYWEENYTGDNAGKIAVLGSGLKFEDLSRNAVDSQLVEQLKWSGETICACFHVPAFMAGVGAAPLNNNVATLGQQYYSQCLQIHIENIEICLDEGLGLPTNRGTELDLDGLIRMDTAAQYDALTKAAGGAFMTTNEARRRVDLKKTPGGDAVYLQQQNYSLEALSKRDAKEDPFASSSAAPALPKPDADTEEEPVEDGEKGFLDLLALIEGKTFDVLDAA